MDRRLTYERQRTSDRRCRGKSVALSRLQRDMEERQCTVDGHIGHVERVYQKRRMVAGVFGCKVILDTGRVVYRDVNDVSVF